jgi:hypothetical protein
VVATLAAAALTGCGDDEGLATAPADGVRLTITGDGAPVRATVTRTDGCEIARWEQLVAPLT